MSSNDENKRIAKNTIWLYLRHVLSVIITLYTSRMILQELGVVDYGVYNAVAGIVLLLAFINGGMVSASQRYITVELQKNNKSRLRLVFSTSLHIHLIVSGILLLLAETIGLWFLCHKMNIPIERQFAAFCVYQFSVAVCVISVMSVPYNACIIAHEHMGAFAYISLVEVILKFFSACIIVFFPWDKLIVYGLLMLVVQLIIRCSFVLFCKRKYENLCCGIRPDFALMKEMLGFSGWSFFGNFASVLYTQGVNILLNIFFGPTANAARGIAVQIQSVLYQFVSNLQMAVNPQTTKSYVSGDLYRMHGLMSLSARVSCMLLLYLILPFFLEIDYILRLWLGEFPSDSVLFCRLSLLIPVVSSLSNPFVVANQATGRVRNYQVVVGCILLSIVPICYIFLRGGFDAYIVFVVHFVIEGIAFIARVYMVTNSIKLNPIKFFCSVCFPLILVIICSLPLTLVSHCFIAPGVCRFIVVFFASAFSISISSYIFALSSEEKLYVFSYVKKWYSSKRKMIY